MNSCSRKKLVLAFLPLLIAVESLGAANESFTDCAQCPEMIPIPAGEYHMGATDEELVVANLPEYFEGRELPRHPVKISRPFAVAKYEVSRAQFAKFVDDTGYAPAMGCWKYIGSEFIFDESWSWQSNGLEQGDDHPVTCISWHDAVAYSDWLSEQSGHHYRLLSEAEWEYTARAGTDTPWWFGDTADEICQYANLGDISTRDKFRWHEQKMKYAPLNNWTNVPCNDGYAATAPVTFGSPNPFGVYNMLGNVQELVADCWQKNYLTGPATEAPRLLSGDCGYRVMRGQGWSAIAASTRSAFRAHMLATDRRFYLGIRVARDLEAGETTPP